MTSTRRKGEREIQTEYLLRKKLYKLRGTPGRLGTLCETTSILGGLQRVTAQGAVETHLLLLRSLILLSHITINGGGVGDLSFQAD